MTAPTMNLTLRVWRQEGPDTAGALRTYDVPGISEDMSFLEMLDVLNDRLTELGEEPIAFEHDCREGICGSCGMMINGQAHGPQRGTATCQLHMRKFADGDVITVEPWRAAAFPVVKDLVVNRSAFDRIVEAGGYISVNTGAAVEANIVPVPKEAADAAFDAAACIGCGACVAACPNSAAPDAGGCIHRGVGDVLGDEDQVRVGRRAGRGRDVAARLDDPIEGAAVDNEVSQHGERRCSPGLDEDLVAVGELAHVQLARRRAALGAVGLAVDHQPTRPADPLAAVVLEGDGLLATGHEAVVDDVEHLEERHVGVDVGDLDGLHLACGVGPCLAPHVQRDPHRRRLPTCRTAA